jgi:hypothetical protein
MKHHRVQMAPVAVSARFCVSDSFSTGRAKSEMPARTMAHWKRGRRVSGGAVVVVPELHGQVEDGVPSLEGNRCR